jgi:hypothetical protein
MTKIVSSMMSNQEVLEQRKVEQAQKVAIAGMDKNAPTITNNKGASQSHLPYRFDLFDGPAMFRMAEVLDEGARKYGEGNWRGITVEDHLNHMIAHAYAYLSGDDSDDHLSHVMCRAMFAQGCDIANEK